MENLNNKAHGKMIPIFQNVVSKKKEPYISLWKIEHGLQIVVNIAFAVEEVLKGERV